MNGLLVGRFSRIVSLHAHATRLFRRATIDELTRHSSEEPRVQQRGDDKE